MGRTCAIVLVSLRRACAIVLVSYSVQIGFAGMNSISGVAVNGGMSSWYYKCVRYVLVAATVVLVIVPSAYIFDKKSRPVVTFTASCKIFLCAAFGLRKAGILSLSAKAEVIGAKICIGVAVLVILCKEVTVNLLSWPSFLLKEGNASTYDNDSDFENLIKGSLLLLAILGGFILQLARPPQCLVLQEKGPAVFGLNLRNPRRGIALILFFSMMIFAVTARVAVTTAVKNETTYQSSERVPVGDKLPPDCDSIPNCG